VKSGGGVSIAVKRDFDVDVIYTRLGLRIEHECVQVKCSEYSYYIDADVGKPAYGMFVEDMDAIVGSSRVTDRILVMGNFNLPKVEDGSTLQPMGITTDLVR
jgi:hypothetical protein